jgi:hypothetical protein
MARNEQPDGQVGHNGEIKSVKGRADQRRRLSERIADALTIASAAWPSRRQRRVVCGLDRH